MFRDWFHDKEIVFMAKCPHVAYLLSVEITTCSLCLCLCWRNLVKISSMQDEFSHTYIPRIWRGWLGSLVVKVYDCHACIMCTGNRLSPRVMLIKCCLSHSLTHRDFNRTMYSNIIAGMVLWKLSLHQYQITERIKIKWNSCMDKSWKYRFWLTICACWYLNSPNARPNFDTIERQSPNILMRIWKQCCSSLNLTVLFWHVWT